MHRFAVGGMVNGLALLWDYETGSYWDHVTGEALHGPLKGERLKVWGIEVTTVAAALANMRRRNCIAQAMRPFLRA